MNRLVALILLMTTVCSAADLAEKVPPRSLLQAIAIAVKNNPKTIAIDELLESIHYSTLATSASRRPRANITCSANRNYRNSTINGIEERSSTTTSGDCSLNAYVTLFDGGVGRYRTRSAEASEAAAAASYNTADSLIPNTRGGLANNTKVIFTSIAEMSAFIQFYQEYHAVLEDFKKFSNDNNLLAVAGNVAQNIEQFESNRALLLADFRYIVTVPADPNLDNFDQIIASLKIPASADEALAIAVDRGPEVLRRNLNVTMAEFNLKAERAELGPFVTLGASVGHGTFRLNSDFETRSNYTNKSVGVTFTLPLDPAGRYRVRAAEQSLASKKSERQAALDDAEHSIRSTYASLTNSNRLYHSFKQNLDEQWAYVRNVQEKVRSGNTAGLDITHMLADMRILDQRFSQFESIQESIVRDLFSIQQVTGLLFENINAPPQIPAVSTK